VQGLRSLIEIKLADHPVTVHLSGMQSVAEKKLVAFEKKIDALHSIGDEVKRLEKQMVEIRKQLDARKDWRKLVGTLTDNPIAREADAFGREIRKKQKTP